MEFIEYVRAHVRLHGKSVEKMSHRETLVAFCMLPPPTKTFDEAKALHDMLFAPQAPPQVDELASNRAAFESIKSQCKEAKCR